MTTQDAGEEVLTRRNLREAEGVPVRVFEPGHFVTVREGANTSLILKREINDLKRNAAFRKACDSLFNVFYLPAKCGSTKQRTGVPARVLFPLLPPSPDVPPESAEAVIFTVILLLRRLHGQQSLLSETPEP